MTFNALHNMMGSKARAIILTALLGLASLPAFAQSTTAVVALNTSQVATSAVLSEELAQAISSGELAQALQQIQSTKKPSVSERIQNVLKRAMSLLGTPYRWGGTSTSGFDCSGLVGYVFRTTLGIQLPRISRDMATTGEQVDRTSLTAGDLVFFGRTGSRVDHVGIYVGDGQFLHAPRTGKDVMVSRLDQGYWSSKFLLARRIAVGS